MTIKSPEMGMLPYHGFVYNATVNLGVHVSLNKLGFGFFFFDEYPEVKL